MSTCSVRDPDGCILRHVVQPPGGWDEGLTVQGPFRTGEQNIMDDTERHERQQAPNRWVEFEVSPNELEACGWIDEPNPKVR